MRASDGKGGSLKALGRSRIGTGRERREGFGLAQGGGKGIFKPEPGRAKEVQGTQLAVPCGSRMMIKRRSQGKLWSDCKGNLESPRGRFLRGTEQGASVGSRKDGSGEQQRAHVQEGINAEGLRGFSLGRPGLQGWTLVGIWHLADKQIPTLIKTTTTKTTFPDCQEWLTVPKLSAHTRWLRLNTCFPSGSLGF